MIERNGMDISFTNLLKATFLGIRPIRHNSSETPSKYNLKYENITFITSDNFSIKGWLMKASAPEGTIIMGHGYNGNRGRLDIAKFLNEKGYNVLMFDFRGHGESDGDYISMGYYERKDISGALEYLRDRKDIDAKNIYGLGQSLGAAALVFAEEEQPSFKALILESIYPDLYENATTRFKKVYGFPEFPFATSLTFFGGLILNVNGFSISPKNSIHNVKVPVLIIHDMLDDSVTLNGSLEVYKNSNEPKELWIVENAVHTGAFDVDSGIYKEKIVSFIEKQ